MVVAFRSAGSCRPGGTFGGPQVVLRGDARPAGGALNAEADGSAQLVEAREQALQRTAWLLTGDWGLAEDLVQAALARSWPRWERINRRDDPEVYVRRMMVNTWTTWSRRRWRGEKASPAVAEVPAASRSLSATGFPMGF
jgi:DNA-directed RNA polymerase specialized sigma24 family protein